MTGGHFLIAGAQRSGTTFLCEMLDRHPEIEMARPLRPEPKYFLRRDGTAGLAEYRRQYFGGKPAARLYGEKSTSYMERSEAAARARDVLRDVKVIFVLRDPVERALSNYRYSVANGVETASIEDALRQEPRRRDAYDRDRFSVSPFAYLSRGHYHRFLAEWEAVVGRRRMYLLLFEDLIGGPAAFQGLCQWLGAASAIEPTITPGPVQATGRSRIDPELRRYLRAHFEESNRRLAARYGLGLSAWQ